MADGPARAPAGLCRADRGDAHIHDRVELEDPWVGGHPWQGALVVISGTPGRSSHLPGQLQRSTADAGGLVAAVEHVGDLVDLLGTRGGVPARCPEKRNSGGRCCCVGGAKILASGSAVCRDSCFVTRAELSSYRRSCDPRHRSTGDSPVRNAVLYWPPFSCAADWLLVSVS